MLTVDISLHILSLKGSLIICKWDPKMANLISYLTMIIGKRKTYVHLLQMPRDLLYFVTYFVHFYHQFDKPYGSHYTFLYAVRV